ncbi:hypothetical protein MRX96_030717 [Rhipicephalus microplus]
MDHTRRVEQTEANDYRPAMKFHKQALNSSEGARVASALDAVERARCLGTWHEGAGTVLLVSGGGDSNGQQPRCVPGAGACRCDRISEWGAWKSQPRWRSPPLSYRHKDNGPRISPARPNEALFELTAAPCQRSPPLSTSRSSQRPLRAPDSALPFVLRRADHRYACGTYTREPPTWLRLRTAHVVLSC